MLPFLSLAGYNNVVPCLASCSGRRRRLRYRSLWGVSGIARVLLLRTAKNG